MRSRLFDFFKIDVLEANLESGDQLSSQNFARFLAAYYLNYPLFTGSEVTDELPCLLTWNESDYNQKPNLSISRLDVANEVPPEYTAKFALQLLLDVCGLIEAVFYTDHFNDARTALQIRLVADYTLDVNLFESHCRESLVAELLGRSDSLAFVQPTDVISAAAPAIEALVQIDAVFGLSCHITVEHLALQLAEQILARLPSSVNVEEVKLPRPPIYATSTESAVDNCEIVAWNKMHYFVHIFLTSLKLTNRLSSFVQFVVGALLKYSPTHIDLNMGIAPTQMFGNVDFSSNETDSFFRVLLIVSQMNARDLFTLSKISPDYEGKTNKSAYNYLLNADKPDPEAAFKIWMGIAEREETEQIVQFLAYVKNDGTNEERYLPPFIEKNRKTWQNHFFTDKKLKTTSSDDSTVCDGFSKFPVDINTRKKLDFISTNWKRFVKSESDLISVFLGLTPDQFVEVLDSPKPDPRLAFTESPLQQLMKKMLLESGQEPPQVEHQPTLTTADFVVPGKRKKRKHIVEEGIYDVNEIRHKVLQESEFMNSVVRERKAVIEHQMKLRVSERSNRPRSQAQPTQHMSESHGLHDDIAAESAQLTHRIRERLEDDLRKLEDGLRDIQQVIRDSEMQEETEERDASSFSSRSSTVVSIPLDALRSVDTAQHKTPPLGGVFRLDLSQLSPPPSVTGHIFIRNDDDIPDSQDSAPLSTIEVPIEATSAQATISDKSSLSKTSSKTAPSSSAIELLKPTWLQLIPWQQTKPCSGRILEMPKEQPPARLSSTARSSRSTVPTPSRHHYDSGFIETTEERVTVVSTRRRKFEYVNGMSQNEIYSVVQQIRNN